MENVNVYSPVEDKNIRTNLNESPIWKKAYHDDDLVEAKKKHSTLWHYTIKFDGLKPIMLNKMSKL
jgi:hypothetical protein